MKGCAKVDHDVRLLSQCGLDYLTALTKLTVLFS